MSLYIYADYFELMTPEKLNTMMQLKTPVGPTTPSLLIIFSILLIVPALMIALSALLAPMLSKWLNILFATIYSIISIMIIKADIGSDWHRFFVLYNVVELFVLVTILWQAWKWPSRQEV